MSISFETLALAKRYTNSAIAEAMGGVAKIDFRFVTSLPLAGESGVIYCVSNGGSEPDLYDEYYYVNGRFERIPGATIDLTPYATKAWVTGEGYYKKPPNGIPGTDLDDALRASIAKAETALQQHQSLAAYRTAQQQDAIDNTLASIKEIEVSDTEPTDPNVSLWMHQNPGQKIEIPTMEDFRNLKPATDEQVSSAVSDWLEENISGGETIAIDKSLTVEGAAADAKVVGDLKSAINELDSIVTGGGGPITFDTVPDEYVEKNGTITPFRSWTRSDYIPVDEYTEVLFDNGATATQYNVFFDSNKDPITGSNFSIPANADGYAVATNGAAYMMISQTTSKFAEISVYVDGTGGIAKQAIYSVEESGGVVTLKNDAGESVVQFHVGVSGDIEIPAYWEQAVSDAIAYVKAMRVNGYSNHIVITDQHYTDNKRHSAAIANRLYQSGFFEKILMLGDIVDSGTTDGDNYKNLLADDYTRNSANMLLVTGNHDVNLDKSVVFNDFVTGNSVVFCSNQYSYCWVWDDDIYKVRYIGIDRSSTYVQYAWLAKAIINAPEDYHICILAHYTMPVNPEWTMNWETDIATALNTLFGMIGHPFVGYVCGHQHIDETDTLDNGGYLTTLICDRFDNQHYYQYYDYPTKVEGTDSEQALTILSVNPDTRNVQFYRVGSCCNLDHKNWGYSYKKIGVQAEIVPFEIITGKYLSNGIERDSADWDATGFIDISGASHVWIATDRTQNSWNMAYNFFFDANQQNPVNIGTNLSSAGNLTELTIPQGAAYLRMSHQTGTLNSLAIIVQT